MKTREKVIAGTAAVAVAITLGVAFRDQLPKSHAKIKEQVFTSVLSDHPSFKPKQYHENLLALKQKAEEKATLYDEAKQKEWRENFPWQPTYDPDVVITQKILDKRHAQAIKENHGFLKDFFKNEERFRPQFQKFYEIVSEYGRDDNPVAIGQSYQCLWELHQILKHDPEELAPGWKPPLTYGQLARGYWGGIGSFIHGESEWPEKDVTQLPPPEIQKVIYRLFTEVQGMDSIPNPEFGFNGDHQDALQLGDSPLVPRVGWQAAHDAWQERVNKQPLGFAYLVDPTGERHSMLKDADGNLVSPLTAEQIQQINQSVGDR